MGAPSRLGLLCVLGVVALLAAGARVVLDMRLHVPELGDWFVYDPDSQYHMARVLAAFDDGLPIAVHDPGMSYPEGADIQWPPGYPLLAYLLLRPLAPEARDAQRLLIEHGMALLPLLCATAAALLAALAGWRLGGAVAALVAGGGYALTGASIDYSAWGNADYHGLTALLTAGLLTLLGAALGRGVLERGRAALAWGAGAGLLAGALIVTWLGALHVVVALELALAVLLLVHARGRLPGLPAFAVALHGAALVVLLPAVVQSPWAARQPWAVVYLTWIQPAVFLLGGCVFLPLLLPLGAGVRRAWPWIVAAAGVAAVALLVGTGSPIVAGIRGGVDFADRSGASSFVMESKPFGGPLDFLGSLGFLSLLLPVAWAFAVRAVWRRPEHPLLGWVVLAPLVAVLALGQSRFAHELALPAAVLLGWGLARLLEARPAGAGGRLLERLAKLPGPLVLVLALAATALSHGATTAALAGRLAAAPGEGEQERGQRAGRLLNEWLRTHTPEPADYSVLNTWGSGNALRWAAERPNVANNFGFYASEEGFRAPARFLLAEEPAEGEAVLGRHRSRYVVVASQLASKLRSLERTLGDSWVGRYLREGPDGRPVLLPRWYRTLGARLVFGGQPSLPSGVGAVPPLDFVRMVYASPVRQFGAPSSWVFEHVPGAWLEARAEPGTPFSLSLELLAPAARQAFRYEATALAGDDGLVRLRVPYASEGPNGDVVPRGPLTWTLGERSGVARVSEQDVQAGRTLVVDA